jgi:hypothetical protein
MYDVVREGGGIVPKELVGAYSKREAGWLAINAYEKLKEYKEENKRPYHKSRANANKDKVRDNIV